MVQQAQKIQGTRVPTYVFKTNRDLSCHLAQVVANTIREQNTCGNRAVLGLTTGSALIGTYRELIRLHREGQLDFSDVVTFNLCEYYGLAPEKQQSFYRWMYVNFFDHVNIPREQIHLLDAMVAPEEVDEYCRRYEAMIDEAGGFDLLLMGINSNGSLAYNEPPSSADSRTRRVTLDPLTRSAASADFFDESNVPLHGLTVGIRTILDARKIVVPAFSESRARIVRRAVEEPVSGRIPASMLQEHQDVAILLDQAAASQLTAIATPWEIGAVEWSDDMVKRAVLWLCAQRDKALLKLDDKDFRKAGLHALLRKHGPSSRVAHRVFQWMMNTIEYHPAGRTPQKVLCFSPHPDDDVISMGGTMIRVVEDGHQLHVAYMTSGNIAVFDHDALRVADLMADMNRAFDIDQARTPELLDRVRQSLMAKHPGQSDDEEVLRIKELIRMSEAKAAGKVCGCREEDLHFLDLPFYRTGTVEKRQPGQDDIAIVRDILTRVEPGQVYVAGDLSDPHGTHRVCAWIIFQALRQLRDETGYTPDVLLYRGAWQEWPADEIEIAVPLSPRDLDRKRQAIFRHESQKDAALFPGTDDREFWQRAEDRNRATADAYNAFGLPEYYGMEAFVRWNWDVDV